MYCIQKPATEGELKVYEESQTHTKHIIIYTGLLREKINIFGGENIGLCEKNSVRTDI